MPFDTAGSPARATALAATGLAFTEPRRASHLAEQALSATGDPEVVSIAERALGMARTALGDLPRAESHLRAAVRGADAAGLTLRAAEARGSLGYVLSLHGRTADALAEIDRATRAAPASRHGVPGVRLLMLRALVLAEAGRFDEAADGGAAALAALAGAGGDAALEADIRNNRSIVLVHRRDWRRAEEDLELAERLYERSGHMPKTAIVYHNRGLAAAVRGDVPAALAAFDEAEERYRGAGRGSGSLPVERAEALLSVLLVAEARRAAETAVAQFTAQRNAVDLVHARLVLARAALLGGDPAAAAEQARRAARSARRQQRPGWAALGGYLALRAQWESGRRTEGMMRAGRRSAAALTEAGWVVEAMDARLVVARIAIELNRPVTARRELAGLDAAAHDGPAELRARAWHARALLRLSDGDRPGAEAALRAGLRVLEEFRASLGATELRVHAAGHGGELARLGMRLAMDSGNARSVLMWTERWRAGAMMLRPARPSHDPELALDLAELRQAVAVPGTVPAPGADLALVRKRQAALEESVRRRTRRVGGVGRTAAGSIASPAGLRAALGPGTLVEYLAVDGELHAVVVTGGAVRLRRIGPAAAVEQDLTALRFGLRRLAYELGSPSSRAAAGRLTDQKAKRLNDTLLGPLLGAVEPGAPLVIVPTGALHALPWATLPSVAGHPLSIAPSAAVWHRAATSVAGPPGGRVFVSGPGLPHAAAEIVEVSRRYRSRRRFTGRRATVEAVLTALDGAELAHIAAHGRFRADNPLFSAVRLVDGPLTVYDLERLARPPRHMILSACDSGLSAVHPGDELLGLAAALLAMGTKSLIATVVPVPDEATKPMMLRLHHHLRGGASPAAALSAAQAELAGLAATDPAARVAATGFSCFGAG